MFGFGKPKSDAFTMTMTVSIRETIETAIRRMFGEVQGTLDKLSGVIDLGKEIMGLRTELETLKIEKVRREEEYARREREIEHKVGLERKRQEQEVALAIREAKVTAKEEAVTADRKRFEEQMKFHEQRFSEEVKYLKEMVGNVLERLPTATILGTVKKS